MALFENSASSWNDEDWWGETSEAKIKRRIAHRTLELRIALRKLLKKHTWRGFSLPLDWSFAALGALIVHEPSFYDSKYHHDSLWMWWINAITRYAQLPEINLAVKMWTIVTGREPTPEEHERFLFCIDLSNAEAQLDIDVNGARVIPARKIGEYAERGEDIAGYWAYSQPEWDRVNANHNARVAARLAAERDACR